MFVGSDHGADALWTIVRTGPPEARHNNLSWLMIDADSPGITYQPMKLIGGMEKYAVYFDEVSVPADRLVGGENKGWTVASTHLELEHGMRTDHLIGTRQSRAWEALARVAATIGGCSVTKLRKIASPRPTRDTSGQAARLAQLLAGDGQPTAHLPRTAGLPHGEDFGAVVRRRRCSTCWVPPLSTRATIATRAS